MAQCGFAGESILGIKMCKHNVEITCVNMLGKVISINYTLVCCERFGKHGCSSANTLFKILCERNCALFFVDIALWHELMVMQIMVLFRRHTLFFSQ